VVISDFRAFVRIAIRIRASTEAQVVCVIAYFKQSRRPALARISSFVSDLIGLLRRSRARLSRMRSVQLLPLNTHNVTAFYVSQIKQRGKVFNDAFGDFRTAIMPLFVLRLSSIRSVELLKAVQCLLLSSGPDRSILCRVFCGHCSHT
jgi:hypothetical protein